MERAIIQQHLAGRKRTPIPNCRIVHVRYVTGTYEVFRQEQCLHQNMETHIKTIRHCFHSTVYPAHIHLIPINKESDMIISNPKLKLSGDEFKEIAERIHQAWNNK